MKKNFSSYTDVRLIQIIKERNSESEMAFTEIYDRYASRVYAYCQRVLNNREHAEDTFQETFYRFYQRVVTDFKSDSVMGFLITIARNLCLNIQRDRKNMVPIDEAEDLVERDQFYENTELTDLVVRSLELLEPEFKEALVLRVYDGIEYNEIAEICGITINLARVRVHRAKEKIKEILTNYDIDLISEYKS